MSDNDGISDEVREARAEMAKQHSAGLKAAVIEVRAGKAGDGDKDFVDFRKDMSAYVSEVRGKSLIAAASEAADAETRRLQSLMRATAFAGTLEVELTALRTMLLQKNAAYGNSALDPVRVFSKADAVEQLKVRIDDKISRLMRGNMIGDQVTAVEAEDVVADLIGYLVLLRIAMRKG